MTLREQIEIGTIGHFTPEEKALYQAPPLPNWEGMTIQARREWLLDNTAKHYRLGNRSKTIPIGHIHPLCRYNGPGGCRCGIGRWIPNAALRMHLDTLEFGGIDAIMVQYPEVAKLLPVWLTEMGAAFLSTIQELHDAACFWDEQGLSDEGKREVAFQRQRIQKAGEGELD